MGKGQLNMRTDSMLLEVFKSMADSRGITQAQLFEQMVNDSSQGKTVEMLSQRLEEMTLTVQEKDSIIAQIEKKYNIKKLPFRKVTFKVTEEQFNNLNKLAHALQLPKCDLMTEHFLKPGSLEGTDKIPKLEETVPEIITKTA